MEIKLYNRQKKVVGVVLVDKEDYELVKGFTWSMSKAGYAYSPKCKKQTGQWYMHRLIMNATSNLVINHINHNKLDNRKQNLEEVTHQENIRKMKKQGGIYFDKARGKWHAQITTNYKTKFIGRFDNHEDAVKARREVEEREWGSV